MATKTATTHLAEATHSLLVARAKAMDRSVSQHLERLVLDDLGRTTEVEPSGADRGRNPAVAGVEQLLNNQHGEALLLIDKLGTLLFETRAAFVNFAIVWAQVTSGAIDPKQFDWRKWAEDHLVAKGGNGRAEGMAGSKAPSAR